MVVVGGFLGRWYASSQPSWRQAAKIVVGTWLVFGVAIYTLLGAGIFGQHLLAGAIWHAASLLIVFGVYGLTLFETYAILAHRAVPTLPDVTRRTLLRNAVVSLVATLGAGTACRV